MAATAARRDAGNQDDDSLRACWILHLGLAGQTKPLLVNVPECAIQVAEPGLQFLVPSLLRYQGLLRLRAAGFKLTQRRHLLAMPHPCSPELLVEGGATRIVGLLFKCAGKFPDLTVDPTPILLQAGDLAVQSLDSLFGSRHTLVLQGKAANEEFHAR